MAMFDDPKKARITDDSDPTKFMPPGRKPFSMLKEGNPVFDLVTHLDAWMAAGKPAGVYTLAATGPATGGIANYSFTPDVAEAMTNLGNCIPSRATFAASKSGEMESLDEFFAHATDLPDSITKTDLTSLDSQVLAATGVIAFVPAYPLYSDGSGKLRHIRVPKGTTVSFNKLTQTFDIPPNTRFYKTFFREITDRTGRVRHRKMETRLIVARPDRPPLPDGVVQQTALFGTYIWNEDETNATLANLPYRDGTPFADQVRTYFTDELAYQQIVDSIGPTGQFEVKLQTALAAALKKTPGLERHYAIPGRIRCVQCHMGSPTKNFVLGFFPLQIARRATGEGGTYDPTGADELSQLQRLIDYGVISGMTSQADVVPLEKSQGNRKPRTGGELAAQGYMLGNCAHCHNARGFPSVIKPELKPVLNFMPDDHDGGVFEFPLDRMSPIRFRGSEGTIPMPYITPSLRDYPVADAAGFRLDNGASVFDVETGKVISWTPKYMKGDFDPGNAKDIGVMSCEGNDPTKSGNDLDDYCGQRTSGRTFVAAPWRSLLYRNVDTPFSYFDDYVPFPHMPMNSVGFDCRAPRIMGDWMVGLPAVRYNPRFPGGIPSDLTEDRLPAPGARPNSNGYWEDTPQPYQDVRVSDPRYQKAKTDADTRLAEYHDSVRYQYCEQTLSPDIYDPVPLRDSTGYHPDPRTFQSQAFGIPFDPASNKLTHAQPAIGVPYHSHYFDYDPTDPPPPFTPRRPDWEAILVDGKADIAIPAGHSTQPTAVAKLFGDRRVTLKAINDSPLSKELEAFATTEVPFGLWQVKPECQQKLNRMKKVSSFQAGEKPAWMTEAKAPAEAPVFQMSPGAALYRHICINCHGPKADGKGLQVDLLAAASTGEARPANFREGLFGPSVAPGENLFAFDIDMMKSVDTARLWGSRYMAWMALGGTLKRIPQDIIHLVQATTILGQPRKNLDRLPGADDVSGNMLNLAKGLCSVVLPEPNGFTFSRSGFPVATPVGPTFYPPYNDDKAPFIRTNGDHEMWIHLCSDFSPPVVRVYEVQGETVNLKSLYYAEGSDGFIGYPDAAPVLDQNKAVQMGVHRDNRYPACLVTPRDPAAIADKAVKTVLHMPYCPAEFLTKGKELPLFTFNEDDQTLVVSDDVKGWSLRGAVAAGMTVFTYLRDPARTAGVNPYYNECQLLP
ncbi:MAG: hypothetical protein ABUR63_04585 [Verrucomicrobiota bacterium]